MMPPACGSSRSALRTAFASGRLEPWTALAEFGALIGVHILVIGLIRLAKALFGVVGTSKRRVMPPR